MNKKLKKIIPSKKQWSKWSLPSRLTAIGSYLAILMFALYIYDKVVEERRSKLIEETIRHQSLTFKDDVELTYSIEINNFEKRTFKYIEELDDSITLKKNINYYRKIKEKLAGKEVKHTNKEWFKGKLLLPMHDLLLMDSEILVQCGDEKTFVGSLDTRNSRIDYEWSIYPHGEYVRMTGTQNLEVSPGLYGKSIYDLCKRDLHLYIDYSLHEKCELSESDFELRYIELKTQKKLMLYENISGAENEIIRNGNYLKWKSYDLTNGTCWYEKIYK